MIFWNDVFYGKVYSNQICGFIKNNDFDFERKKISNLESVLGIQIIFKMTKITDRAALTQEEFISKIWHIYYFA